ncbi:MAG TPA: NADH-quinone oxidoreductase subunit A [Pseudonocardiaceae bacterium]|jgi:NADH-quinone oxidoreductase subunit A|nr:NADH-quinone oxidoreductase subunit A [Pseudonocardiaceae bacterium]
MAAVQVVEAAGTPTALGPYLPIFLLFVLAAGFAGASALLAAPNMGPKRYNKAKFEGYECGIEPSPQPIIGGGRVPVAYYLTAMLFILFDIEMVFLYPFAVSADALGIFGVVEIVLFIASVAFAYVYVWRRGGLDWN